MTYLNLVNGVLRRLREDEVSNVSESTYSKMVGDYVNDAKDLVETAWDWSPLRNTLTITTSNGDNLYSLTGSLNEGKVLNFIQEAVTGSPKNFTYAGVDGSGDTQVKLYPTPDQAYTLKVRVVLRNVALSADADTLAIPSGPVLHMAIALLSRERGETGGTSTAEYFAIADKHLSDAIALDAQKHPEETIFYTP